MPTSRITEINCGTIETKNLAECLAVNFVTLFTSVFPDASRSAKTAVSTALKLGILARMDAIAAVLLEEYGTDVLDRLKDHSSDTVRGWGAFVVGRIPGLSLKKRLAMIQTFANDHHFGVREWAWMAVRKQISSELEPAIEILASWATHSSPNIRRFASEATRPRGVWAPHITTLKENPEIALPVLEPLKTDPDRYVQDSVANWLNDAAKSKPDWVRHICKRWSACSSSKATAHIVKRAQRSISTSTK